ncbi:hypothetical protein JOF56_009070 [Kibdelosporangium banguiense]|uniref:GH15-like domain-containing protein n=1 Tax=Kibdelosporangium banguiense TaxID=1365924 RepID=A0ABS4TXI5_9PSEU|nr:glycoside hydrolase family 15 protein [Kibdelosporangium banguiense]MBP2328685.1 hypothetical protein [Kibdelosporangium banguiense]
MDFLESRWREPDNGLWELRGPRRHFTHSKVMAWVAADRAVKGIEQFGLDGPLDDWKLRQVIFDEVCERGYDSERQTFTQYYGSSTLDASLLLIPAVTDVQGLRQHLRTDTEISSAEYDETAARWTLTTRRGDRYTADVVVFGVGQLHRPKLPDIAGREDFTGPAFHTAQWDHAQDLTGRRVAEHDPRPQLERLHHRVPGPLRHELPAAPARRPRHRGPRRGHGGLPAVADRGSGRDGVAGRLPTLVPEPGRPRHDPWPMSTMHYRRLTRRDPRPAFHAS